MLKERKKKKNKNQLDSNTKFLSFYLKANTATVSPPLSSVFGNLGLNTQKFCKEFNALTEELNSIFLLKVFVKIDLTSKTWNLKISKLPVTFLYRLISLKKKMQFTGLGGFFFKEISYITLKNFFLVILFINNKITKEEILNKLAIIKSMDMAIIDDKEIILKD